jgi:hypothetical protein
MEMYWGVKVWSHTSSFLAIDGGGIFTMNGWRCLGLKVSQ